MLKNVLLILITVFLLCGCFGETKKLETQSEQVKTVRYTGESKKFRFPIKSADWDKKLAMVGMKAIEVEQLFTDDKSIVINMPEMYYQVEYLNPEKFELAGRVVVLGRGEDKKNSIGIRIVSGMAVDTAKGVMFYDSDSLVKSKVDKLLKDNKELKGKFGAEKINNKWFSIDILEGRTYAYTIANDNNMVIFTLQGEKDRETLERVLANIEISNINNSNRTKSNLSSIHNNIKNIVSKDNSIIIPLPADYSKHRLFKKFNTALGGHGEVVDSIFMTKDKVAIFIALYKVSKGDISIRFNANEFDTLDIPVKLYAKGMENLDVKKFNEKYFLVQHKTENTVYTTCNSQYNITVITEGIDSNKIAEEMLSKIEIRDLVK